MDVVSFGHGRTELRVVVELWQSCGTRVDVACDATGWTHSPVECRGTHAELSRTMLVSHVKQRLKDRHGVRWQVMTADAVECQRVLEQ